MREGLPRGLGGVLAGGAVHLVQPFRPLVVRLEGVVVDGPGRGHAVDVRQLAEVLAPHPEQDAAPELGVPPDAVVRIGAERLAVAVAPLLRRLVAPVPPDRGGVAVLGLPRHEAAPFEEQDAGGGVGEGAGEGAPAGAGPDDDDVVTLARHRRSDSGRAPHVPPPAGACPACGALGNHRRRPHRPRPLLSRTTIGSATRRSVGDRDAPLRPAAKDGDGNYLAARHAQEPKRTGCVLNVLGEVRSITVLRPEVTAHRPGAPRQSCRAADGGAAAADA